jgi:hypothetical protein
MGLLAKELGFRKLLAKELEVSEASRLFAPLGLGSAVLRGGRGGEGKWREERDLGVSGNKWKWAKMGYWAGLSEEDENMGRRIIVGKLYFPHIIGMY